MSIYRKAERRKAKLRLAITGPAGSGKTYSALLIAFGIGGKTALLDTETAQAIYIRHLEITTSAQFQRHSRFRNTSTRLKAQNRRAMIF